MAISLGIDPIFRQTHMGLCFPLGLSRLIYVCCYCNYRVKLYMMSSEHTHSTKKDALFKSMRTQEKHGKTMGVVCNSIVCVCVTYL